MADNQSVESEIENILDRLAVRMYDEGQLDKPSLMGRQVAIVNMGEAKAMLTTLIDSAKREVLEEMRPANATIESMRMYTPRTHTYMGKEYPACSICGFCPEAMNAFIDAQLEQSKEKK